MGNCPSYIGNYVPNWELFWNEIRKHCLVIMKNLTEKIALEFLESKGYLTDYLYHRSEVQKKYNATDEEADDILRNVVGSDGIVERIQDGIEILCEANSITEKL